MKNTKILRIDYNDDVVPEAKYEPGKRTKIVQDQIPGLTPAIGRNRVLARHEGADNFRRPWLEVELQRGMIMQIDAADWPLVSRYRWFAIMPGGRYFYPATKIKDPETGKWKTHTLHSILTAPRRERGLEVDHISGLTLDNRRSNLRLATRRQNQANSKARRNSKTGFRGIDFINGRFRVKVASIYRGSFLTLELAKAAYNRAALHEYGRFARLHTLKIQEAA